MPNFSMAAQKSCKLLDALNIICTSSATSLKPHRSKATEAFWELQIVLETEVQSSLPLGRDRSTPCGHESTCGSSLSSNHDGSLTSTTGVRTDGIHSTSPGSSLSLNHDGSLTSTTGVRTNSIHSTSPGSSPGATSLALSSCRSGFLAPTTQVQSPLPLDGTHSASCGHHSTHSSSSTAISPALSPDYDSLPLGRIFRALFPKMAPNSPLAVCLPAQLVRSCLQPTTNF